MRKLIKRSRKSLTDVTGYVDLPTACVRANQTGFFGLSQRVNPESFDGNDTNIDPRECFFGGRRIDIALQLQKAQDLATKSPNPVEVGPSGDGSGAPPGESE